MTNFIRDQRNRPNKPKENRAGDKNKVSQMDVCQTPPHALEPLYPYVPKEWIIWESMAGPEQLIVNALHDNGYDNVIATDLLYGEQYNYYTYEPEYYDLMWTNLAFSHKYDALKLAFERGVRFIVLVPYETTFAKEFQTLFKQYNGNPWFIEVLSPERRINFKMPNMGWGIKVWNEVKQKWVKKGDSAQMPTMWLTWGLNVSAHRTDYLRTFYVPMRSVKYNDDNTEKV